MNSIPHLSSFIPHHSWCSLWFLFFLGLSAFGQDEANDAPSPVPFPGDGIVNNEPPFLAGVTVDHAELTYREGERLRAQFMAEREAYLYLIYHQADGRSRLLFPNPSQADNRAPAKQPVVIPGPAQPLRFRIGPPFGDEVLQVIATLEPAPELAALVRGAAFPGRPSSAPDGLGSPPHDKQTPLPTAPVVSQQLLDQLKVRLLKDKTSWTEHRVVLRTVPKAGAPTPRKAARVGLFIGIGKYQHPELAPTHVELSHSAEVMHELMLKRGGLDPDKTKLVVNEQATKANLQELVMRWLPGVSRPGDVVFLYFSGHAGQFDTNDPSETDGKDESLGPYDLNAGPENLPLAQRKRRYRDSSILDDTLARWLQALVGRQVVLIVDSCHAGGLVQDKDLPLPLPPGEGRGEGGSRGLPLTLFTDEAARLKDISQLNTIIISSCASDEQSLFQGIKNKTMWFTFCLTEVLTSSSAPHPLTVQAAFAHGRKRMKQLLAEGNAGIEQEPTMVDGIMLPVVMTP
ncbi:MAG TPA: caspase family protein [Pirellulales bacterium]|nr:caspase family protein [Pirellulales bacterium]